MKLPTDRCAELTVINDSLRIFRTDLLTRGRCGNKEYKLTKNLAALKQQGCRSVLSFGGVWSNHLHALAHSCESIGLTAVAMVRGEEQLKTALLLDAMGHGLQVHYLSRADYRMRGDEHFVSRLCEKYHCDAWLPEGGSNELAVSGCREIAVQINEVAKDYATHIVVAVGTGATMAGIICGSNENQTVVGVPVVQDDRLIPSVSGWIKEVGQSHHMASNRAAWTMLNSAAPSRYGRVDKSLLDFVLSVHAKYGVVMDPVYNGKALKALQNSQWVKNPDNKIVFVHTGGIGGSLGYKAKFADLCGAGSADQYLADAKSAMSG